ncbi:D-cysteine desulfhydrase family protein [bacterium]|nr:D-cysteine desulfhydrase family protein [bacterium]
MIAAERLRFAHLPTPIEELPRLSAALGGPRLFVKRDDQTGLALGGNKTRKLEFLLAEALQQGADTVVTAGAAQSNHCRQTAAAAARCGLGCVLVLSGDQPVCPDGNLLLDALCGATVVWVAERARREQVQLETCERLRAEGRRPYFVPYGGSSPTGVLGYAHAMAEACEQGPHPDWMVFGTSSGGTQAGLLLGGRLSGCRSKVLGISIDESAAWLADRVCELATQGAEKLGERCRFTPDDVLVDDTYCQAGYGVLTGREREAIVKFARREGLLLDPGDTGRAAAGLLDLIRRGFFAKTDTILFWHTGGQPALFADAYRTRLV